MHCQCVRQIELPGISRLYADVLYHPERTQGFYAHPQRGLEGLRAAAAAVDLPAGRRAALVEALGADNPPGPALGLLAREGTVAVVTGQQVGLFSGPCYTVYKILHAVKLAAWLGENGIPAVPVFWLATEDHDFAEVNHAWVFDASHRPHRVAMECAVEERPAGSVVMSHPPLDGLRAALGGLPFAREAADLVAEAYQPGRTMGAAFQALLRRLLERFDILYLDPLRPAIRELAAPALARAVEAAPDLTRALLGRNRELAAAGYHAQVHLEEATSLVFLLEEGRRLGLRRHGAEYVHSGRRFSAGELTARAAALSPNALLRPVIQDSMLPTAAYVGGPAEVAYFAQSAVIYRMLGVPMPVAVPRTGFTVLDHRSAARMERYGLGLGDFFHGEAALAERVASRLVPQDLNAAAAEARETVDRAVAKLDAVYRGFDPGLARALDRSTRRIRYQMEKMARKTAREALLRDERARSGAASLYGLIYPERTLQERFYSMVALVAKHGPELIGEIYQAVDPACPDHRLLTL